MMIKRALSLILSLVMVLGMMPVNIAATADEIPTEDLSVPETTAPTLEESIPVETAEAFETDIPVVSEEEIAAVSTDTVMTQEELVSAIQSAYNNGESWYTLTESVEITSDCTISDRNWERHFSIIVGESGNLTIKEGATFALAFDEIPGEMINGEFSIGGGSVVIEGGASFAGRFSIIRGTMNVKAGGTLNAGYTWINGGNLSAETGANVTGHFSIQLNNSSISGVDAGLIEASHDTSSVEDLEKALADSAKYRTLEITNYGDIIISRNITVPQNVSFYWGGNLSVSAGATLTNYGTVNTYSGTMSVEETGAIVNHGLLTCKENGLTNYGTVSGNAILYVNTDGELCITTYEQLKQLENCGGLSATPTVTAPITLSDDVTYGGWARIAEGGELIVPDGVTLTVPGILHVYGRITVKAGGTLALNPGYDQCIQLYGSITVEEGGDIVNISQYQDEPGIVLLGDHAETHGVPGEFLIASATTTEEFEALLEQGVARIFIEGNVEMNNHYTQILDQEVMVLSGGTLTINNRVLFQGEKAKLIVYYGGVLTVNRYDLSFFSNGSLTVEEGGKLYNNHTITIGTAGVVNIESGAAVVNENARFYIWDRGTLNIEAGASFDNSKGFIHIPSEGSINDPAGILTNNGFIDDGIIDNSGWTAGGACGDSLYWSIENKTLTISGTGRMYDYDGYFDGRNGPMPPWSDYYSIIDFLVIEPGITHIGNMAFGGSFTSIVVPEGVTSIGDFAFWSCTELVSIELPEGIVSMGEYVFAECYKLPEIDLPDSLQTIGAYAFYGCSELKSITIPAGITKIHEETFSYCQNLIRIKFTGNAPVFETNAWGGVFNSVTAFAYYPAGNATWTEDVRQNYGGTISWVAYEPAVATVNGTEYSSLEDAFSAAESGDVVQLNQDAEVGDVVLRRGVGLDLNGHELAADYVFAVKGAEIADNSEGNTGLLKVDAKHVMISKENAQLPVWNGEGYVFTTVTYKTRLMEHDNDKLKFAFLPQFKAGATALLEDGVDGNKVTIEVRVSWLTKMGREYRNLVFNEQQVDTVVGTNGAFILTFSGFSQLDMASGITVEGIVISETGVSIASTPVVVEVNVTE